jgi:hypothetical protein
MSIVSEDYVALAEADSEAQEPQTLFHTLLTVTDYEANPDGTSKQVWPLGTHGSLEAAKAFSFKALQALGYAPSDFLLYAERPASKPKDDESEGEGEKWPYGDGTMVYARRTGPHDFLVSISTTPNPDLLPLNPDPNPANPSEKDTLLLPDGTNHLHYLLQTQTDFATGRSSTNIEGVYPRRSDAVAAARTVLLSPEEDGEVKRSDFAEYDVYDEGELKGEWPYGEDVVVHAIAVTGENYVVAVRNVLGTHERHRNGQKN